MDDNSALPKSFSYWLLTSALHIPLTSPHHHPESQPSIHPQLMPPSTKTESITPQISIHIHPLSILPIHTPILTLNTSILTRKKSHPEMSVTLHTNLGAIKIEVFCESVPKTAEVCNHRKSFFPPEYLSSYLSIYPLIN